MKKSERTKAFIVEKTAALFNKKGYAGTSLTDLTKATGLTKGALYGNFDNKDKIALAVYDYNVNKIQSYFTADDKTAIEKLLAIPRIYKQHFAAIAAHGGCPILNAAIESDDNQPLLRKKVYKTITEWTDGIAAIIREGIRAGEIRKGTDALRYARIFIALFEGGMMLSKATKDVSYFNDALDRMTDMVNKELRK